MNVPIKKMTQYQEAKARIRIMKEIVRRMIAKEKQINCVAV
jgi:hypothetical protein